MKQRKRQITDGVVISFILIIFAIFLVIALKSVDMSTLLSSDPHVHQAVEPDLENFRPTGTKLEAKPHQDIGFDANLDEYKRQWSFLAAGGEGPAIAAAKQIMDKAKSIGYLVSSEGQNGGTVWQSKAVRKDVGGEHGIDIMVSQDPAGWVVLVETAFVPK